MTDMELDVFERASVHYAKKLWPVALAPNVRFLKRDTIVMEFWTDYFSGKHIYTTTK